MNHNQEVQVLWGAWSQEPRANHKVQPVRAGLEEVKSDSCGSTNRNPVEGVPSQGERSPIREALATKATDVNLAIVQRRRWFLPEEISPHA